MAGSPTPNPTADEIMQMLKPKASPAMPKVQEGKPGPAILAAMRSEAWKTFKTMAGAEVSPLEDGGIQVKLPAAVAVTLKQMNDDALDQAFGGDATPIVGSISGDRRVVTLTADTLNDSRWSQMLDALIQHAGASRAVAEPGQVMPAPCPPGTSRKGPTCQR